MHQTAEFSQPWPWYYVSSLAHIAFFDCCHFLSSYYSLRHFNSLLCLKLEPGVVFFLTTSCYSSTDTSLSLLWLSTSFCLTLLKSLRVFSGTHFSLIVSIDLSFSLKDLSGSAPACYLPLYILSYQFIFISCIRCSACSSVTMFANTFSSNCLTSISTNVYE